MFGFTEPSGFRTAESEVLDGDWAETLTVVRSKNTNNKLRRMDDGYCINWVKSRQEMGPVGSNNKNCWFEILI